MSETTSNPINPQDHPDHRGPGGDPLTKPEMAMVRQAIKDRWHIPERYRQELYGVLVQIAVSPGSNSRNKISAIKTLIAMDRNNLDFQRLQQAGGKDADDFQLELDLAPEDAEAQ